MRLIFDTNVLVSALIQRSHPYLILNKVLTNDDFKLCISDSLFAEYIEVLSRDKFSRFPDFYARAQSLLASLDKVAVKFNPAIRLQIINDDPDNRLLELAEVSQAEYLVSPLQNITIP